LNKAALDKHIGFFMTGNGPVFVDRSVVSADGRGAGPDGRPFAGQVFFNPQPGSIGTLQRRMFSGPSVFSFDAGIQKSTRLTERHSLELRMEAQNILNHPTFYVGDESAATGRFDINSPSFGLIRSTFTDRRLVQFGLYWRF
jgi:hypothetical protein